MRLEKVNKTEIETEIPILTGSSLIGMKVKDVLEEFNMEFIHMHNPKVQIETREEKLPFGKVLELGMALKVRGKHEDVDRLFDFAFS